MTRILIAGVLALVAAGQAFAADLPQPAPPPPRAPAAYIPAPSPVYNWTGVYLGINGGWGFGSSDWSDPNNSLLATSTGNFNTSGGLVGGTIGANFQMSQFVFGIEADIDWANLKGSVTPTNLFCTQVVPGVGIGATCNTRDDWLGTVRARVGYAIDRVLIYGTGGVAFGDIQAGLSGGTVGTTSYQTSTEVGWTAGGGIEYAFTDNLTARAEYLFVDLQNGSCTSTASCGVDILAPGTVSDTVKFNASLVRAGLDYKFGPF